jgi:hypothetical protein
MADYNVGPSRFNSSVGDGRKIKGAFTVGEAFERYANFPECILEYDGEVKEGIHFFGMGSRGGTVSVDEKTYRNLKQPEIGYKVQGYLLLLAEGFALSEDGTWKKRPSERTEEDIAKVDD